MEYKRVIRFQYYQVLCKKKNEKNKWSDFEAFDLVDWINRMDREKKTRTPIEFGNALASVDSLGYKKDSDLWGIRLMKLRDTNIPTKVKKNKESEAFELKDDEYIGEDVTLIYEKKSSLAMIQSNRFSLGISRLEEFFNYTNNDASTRIFIQPVLRSNDLGRLKKCNYKSIDIAFANLGSWNNEDDCKSLASLITPIKKMGGYAGHITIGLGHTKNDALNRIESNNIVNDILSNKRFIRSAKVKVRDDDDTDVEIVDLFEEVYHDFIEFTLESKSALGYQEAINAMVYYFNKRKADLYSAVKYSDGDD